MILKNIEIIMVHLNFPNYVNYGPDLQAGNLIFPFTNQPPSIICEQTKIPTDYLIRSVSDL